MARLFAWASSQYLEIDQPAATAAPLTIACRYNAVSLNDVTFLVTLHDKDEPGQGFRLGFDLADIIAETYAGSYSYSVALSSSSTGVWEHACAVFYAANSRAAFHNGANKGTDTVSLTPAGIDRTSIGRAGDSTPGYYFDGSIAEAAIWSAALTDDEVAILAKGVSPLLVRPESLVFYCPLIRDDDEDIVGGLSLTAVNGPTVTAHPRVLYHAGVQVGARGIIGIDVVWGHDTGVLEANVRDFNGNWTGTGTIGNPGVADTERLELETGEYMESEMVFTDVVMVELLQNEYAEGDDVLLRYRHGASAAACHGAAWQDYVAPFLSAGYVEIRVESTL